MVIYLVITFLIAIGMTLETIFSSSNPLENWRINKKGYLLGLLISSILVPIIVGAILSKLERNG